MNKTAHIVFAFLLASIVVYPSSPILQLLLVGDYQISMALFAVATLMFTWIYKSCHQPGRFNAISKLVRAYWLSITAICIISFTVTGSKTALRDVLFISAICGMILYLPRQIYVHIVEYYVFILSALIIIASMGVIIFFSGLIDQQSWYVPHLSLNENNAICSREAGVDGFNYYLPLYLGVVAIPNLLAEQGFGFTFIRQPFIFTEPAYAWAYLAPLWFLVFGDRTFRNRIFCLFSISVALIFSFSVWGILSVLLTLIILYLIRRSKKPFSAVLITILFLLPVSYYYEPILTAVSPSKLEAVKSIVERADVMGRFSSVPFGLKIESDFGGDAGNGSTLGIFGALSILPRYGYCGMLLYICWLIVVALWAIKYFKSRKPFVGASSSILLGATFVSLLVLLKVPQITILPTLILLGYFNAKWSVYKSFDTPTRLNT